MLKIAFNLIFHYQLFRPTAMINHVSDMRQIVKKEGINYVIFDKDDTLVPVYEFTIRDQKIKDTLNEFHSSNIFVMVVSNSVIIDEHDQPSQMRVNNGDNFFEILLTKYPKPHNGQEIRDLMKIQRQLSASKKQLTKQKVAVVGDRLLTDIHLGNLMGWHTYLVKPLQKTTLKKHGIAVYLMRQFQNFLIARSNFPKNDNEKTNKQ